MYCPKCATHNLDNARFCRACGADISLVPQALTGLLPKESDAMLETSGAHHRARAMRRRGKKVKEPSLEAAIKSIFMGVAFLMIFFVGLAVFRHAFPVWFWAIIPGLACMGEGVAQYVRFKHAEQKSLQPAPFAPASMQMPPVARHLSSLAPHDTSEIVPPPGSVTEGTTRHLGVRKERAE